MSLNEVIIQICEETLEGKINLGELYKRWPKEAEKSLYLQVVYDDLEDGIEHAPANFFTRKLDINKWLVSFEYRKIYFHLELLKTKKSEEACLKVMKLFEGKSPKNVMEVDALIKGM